MTEVLALGKLRDSALWRVRQNGTFAVLSRVPLSGCDRFCWVSLYQYLEHVNPFTPRVNIEPINVVLTFKSVDETLVCDHSNESY